MLDLDREADEVWSVLGDVAAVHRSCRYSYRHLHTLLPVRESTGTFRVEGRPGGSRVVWDAEVEPLDPASADAVTAMVAGAFQESLDALGGYLSADADRSA